MRVHSVSYHSRANGPGVRTVLHVQGCSLGCKGCINPGTWDPGLGIEMSVQEVLARMKDRDCDGYTISGGEPVEQWEELLEVLDGLGGETGHSIVLFTGYSREELCSVARWEALAARCDVLVSGRFEATSLLPQGQRSGLIASSNQETFYLRGRVTPEDMVGVPEAEVHIGSDGRIRISGLPSGKLVNWVRG